MLNKLVYLTTVELEYDLRFLYDKIFLHMQIITTRKHALLDYMCSFLLISAPWLLGFNDGGIAHWLPVLAGVAFIIISLFTLYEGGIFRAIPMKTHLAIDVAVGLLLLISPWLFRFSHEVYIPHVAFGTVVVVISLFTKPMPYRSRHISYSVW